MRAFVRNRKLRCAVGLLAVLAVFVAVGVVFASSGGGESGFDKGKDLIWRIMNFVVLAGGLTFLLRKPVAKGLESRRQGIRDQLDDLEKRKQKAEKELSEYQQKLNQLDKEVEKIVAEYVKDGEAL
ncbi:MAG: ATP synthase F0 subunit B, partial [Deltaproteobacteria bacterium]|nr:ATP synthase F0 subunit B [Deltaproteobacteria bacterium]